jgi:hypothetical protein
LNSTCLVKDAKAYQVGIGGLIGVEPGQSAFSQAPSRHLEAILAVGGRTGNALA